MKSCRFELQIKNAGRFHCALRFGFSGWAYTWKHGDFDPCPHCPVKIEGKPLPIDRELKPSEFGEVAGKRIRRKDWIEVERRGYEVNSRGIEKVVAP